MKPSQQEPRVLTRSLLPRGVAMLPQPQTLPVFGCGIQGLGSSTKLQV